MTGLLPVTRDEYHADLIVTGRPSLSASVASILCTSSPAHARAAHPLLNPLHQRVEEDKFDLGNAAHQAILEGVDNVEVIEADSWRTKAAREQRDTARAYGRTAMLYDNYQSMLAMVEAVGRQIGAVDARPPILKDGKAEQTLAWEDRGVLCRARLDWLRDDLTAIDDLKTTSRSASPEAWSRALYSTGADIQAAFYLRGMEVAFGRTDVEWRWVIVETYPPYAVSVVSPGPDVLTLGRKKMEYAMGVWARCLRDDVWPAYPAEVCFAELPAFEEARWLAKEERELVSR